MTRETAINNIPGTFKMLEAYVLEDTVGAMQAIIDVIYDDFESRTCSSCKYSSTYSYQEVWCGMHSEEFFKTYGCNKWLAED